MHSRIHAARRRAIRRRHEINFVAFINIGGCNVFRSAARAIMAQTNGAIAVRGADDGPQLRNHRENMLAKYFLVSLSSRHKRDDSTVQFYDSAAPLVSWFPLNSGREGGFVVQLSASEERATHPSRYTGRTEPNCRRACCIGRSPECRG